MEEQDKLFVAEKVKTGEIKGYQAKALEWAIQSRRHIADALRRTDRKTVEDLSPSPLKESVLKLKRAAEGTNFQPRANRTEQEIVSGHNLSAMKWADEAINGLADISGVIITEKAAEMFPDDKIPAETYAVEILGDILVETREVMILARQRVSIFPAEAMDRFSISEREESTEN